MRDNLESRCPYVAYTDQNGQLGGDKAACKLSQFASCSHDGESRDCQLAVNSMRKGILVPSIAQAVGLI